MRIGLERVPRVAHHRAKDDGCGDARVDMAWKEPLCGLEPASESRFWPTGLLVGTLARRDGRPMKSSRSNPPPSPLSVAIDRTKSSSEKAAQPSVAKTSGRRSGQYEERLQLEQSLVVEERRLAEAEEVCARSRARANELRATLAALLVGDSPIGATVAPSDHQAAATYSTDQKLSIFRELFRGRDDVYPVRWENRKKGTSGYAPECANKFVDGVCDIKHVRCHECPNRELRAVDDDVLLSHLRGRRVVGIYPLLSDNTCWFLAIDFDEKHWQRDIGAVRDICRDLAIPCYVERSRSGNGGHVWFFFNEPLPASEARRLGSYVLTETMSRHLDLSFTSYDRLFPNQDTMPTGGFGNLIALPLQGASRAVGNSVFVDDSFVPYAGDE